MWVHGPPCIHSPRGRGRSLKGEGGGHLRRSFETRTGRAPLFLRVVGDGTEGESCYGGPCTQRPFGAQPNSSERGLLSLYFTYGY